MNEIIEALQKLNENFGDILGRDGAYLSDQVGSIIALAKANQPERGETNSERVKRIIAERNENEVSI